MTKTKRFREKPSNFTALQAAIESQIKDERVKLFGEDYQLYGSSLSGKNSANLIRDYEIKYIDGDKEAINVSDDDDLITAYDVAEKELSGNLRFIIKFK